MGFQAKGKYLERADYSWSSDSIRHINTSTVSVRQLFLYVQEVGYFRTRPPYFTERANLHSFLIIYTLSGRGLLRLIHLRVRRAVEDRDVEVGQEVMRCSHVCVYLETQHSLRPCEEDLLMTVQLRLSCAESRHAVVVECKVPVCWLPRRGVPVEFRFGEVPWGSPAVVDRSLNRVLDYDPRCHAFVPSPRRERETYAERYAHLMKQ